MSDLTNKRVFDSLEEINQVFGVDLTIPSDLPKGCNLLCYIVRGLYNVELFHPYKIDNSLYHYGKSVNRWILSNESLDRELAEDKLQTHSSYIYLHLTTKAKFTSECMLGVETNYGYVTAVYEYGYIAEGFVFDLDGVGQYQPSAYRYYISDDNDETVSFEEYVKLFYDVEGVL